MSARAALDAARAVFAPSLGRPPAEATTAPQWVELPDGASSPRTRSVAMWNAAEHVLQAVVGRSDLAGQAVVGEARRLQRLSLADAYALVALQGWLDRLRDAANTEAGVEAMPLPAEQQVARDAWQALEHAVTAPIAQAVTASSAPTVTQPIAQATTQASAASMATPSWAPLGATSPGTTAAGAASPGAASRAAAMPPTDVDADAEPEPPRKWYRSSGALIGAMIVVLVGAAGVWYALNSRRDRDYREGVAAYQRGAREVARMAFVKAARSDANDARPLVFLGRMAREDNDLPPARRFLESAVRIDPQNPTALRELGSALLADGQPEIARRFYVRALELNPTDRLAQGFLGCTLFRLGRADEARRWVERAGQGDWTPCVSAPMPAPPLRPPQLRAPPPP